MFTEKQKNQLVWEISDAMIEFAQDYDKMTISDAQGVAEARAHEIVMSINKLKKVM
jgi:hypothetical protein